MSNTSIYFIQLDFQRKILHSTFPWLLLDALDGKWMEASWRDEGKMEVEDVGVEKELQGKVVQTQEV